MEWGGGAGQPKQPHPYMNHPINKPTHHFKLFFINNKRRGKIYCPDSSAEDQSSVANTANFSSTPDPKKSSSSRQAVFEKLQT